MVVSLFWEAQLIEDTVKSLLISGASSVGTDRGSNSIWPLLRHNDSLSHFKSKEWQCGHSGFHDALALARSTLVSSKFLPLQADLYVFLTL